MLRPDDPKAHDERVGQVKRAVVLDPPRDGMLVVLHLLDAPLLDREPPVPSVSPLLALPLDLSQRHPHLAHEPFNTSDNVVPHDPDVRVAPHEGLDNELQLQSSDHGLLRLLAFALNLTRRSLPRPKLVLEVEELDAERTQQRVRGLASLDAVCPSSPGEQVALLFERGGWYELGDFSSKFWRGGEEGESAKDGGWEGGSGSG